MAKRINRAAYLEALEAYSDKLEAAREEFGRFSREYQRAEARALDELAQELVSHPDMVQDQEEE